VFLHFAVRFGLGWFYLMGFGVFFGCVCKRLGVVVKVKGAGQSSLFEVTEKFFR
jgi:hypothetical protein